MSQTNTQNALFTRQDYMADKCTHEQYYAQFINAAGIEMVKKSQAYKTLIKKGSKDVSLVEVGVWDLIGTAGEAVNLMKTLGDNWSLAGAVCINKAIARQLLEAA
jgi:hypothetical protein